MPRTDAAATLLIVPVFTSASPPLKSWGPARTGGPFLLGVYILPGNLIVENENGPRRGDRGPSELLPTDSGSGRRPLPSC